MWLINNLRGNVPNYHWYYVLNKGPGLGDPFTGANEEYWWPLPTHIRLKLRMCDVCKQSEYEVMHKKSPGDEDFHRGQPSRSGGGGLTTTNARLRIGAVLCKLEMWGAHSLKIIAFSWSSLIHLSAIRILLFFNNILKNLVVQAEVGIHLFQPPIFLF